MTQELTSSVRAAGPILQVLAEGGVDFGQVVARLGVDPAVFADQDARIPVSKLVPLWNLAEELLDDPFVGLHVAQKVSRESFDIFSYIATASANLGEALARIERYFRLITDGGNYETRREGDDAWWAFRAVDRDASPNRHDGEYAMATSVAYTRQWLGTDFSPREVFFRHPKPADTSELEGFFEAPIRFETNQCAFRFDPAFLRAPLRTADPKLGAFLERYAEEALAALPDPGRLAGQVRALLIQGLPNGETSLPLIAKRLAVSDRSLQRQLQDEGTNHKKLLDEVRRELATRYLTKRDLSVSEVAYMLGFSETAPFFRAFKKWTGQTPGEFRKAKAAAP